MKIGKVRMFFLLNGLIALILLVYFSVWIFYGKPVDGRVVPPLYSPRVHVEYIVEGEKHTGEFMRYGIEYSTRRLPLLYLPHNPSSARIGSFMGIAAEPLGWWLVFLLASAFLLLTNNIVFSKGTRFLIRKKFPWISMEEYFRLPWYFNHQQQESDPPQSPDPWPPRLNNS